MALDGLLSIFSVPNLRAQLRINGDIRAATRLNFLYAGLECKLFCALRMPATFEELTETLRVTRPHLLQALLEVGVALKELGVGNGAYRLRGARSLALSDAKSDQLAAFIQESVAYHGSVYENLTARMRGEPLGNYLQQTGDMIARSSRILEPFVARFVRSITRQQGPLELLEIGCGSGVYLRHAAEANHQITGTAIDMRPDVIEQATRNLSRWEIADRFRVVLEDIRSPSKEVDGPFGLITLYNNIYYFETEERVALFESIRARLTPDGKLAVVSLMQANNITSSNFDLVLRSTAGAAPLPRIDELTGQLNQAGFGSIRAKRLMPGEALYGVVAK